MSKEHHNENKNDEEDTFTLAKLVSTWYVGAVVGFALGTLKSGSTTLRIHGSIFSGTHSTLTIIYNGLIG